MDLALLVVAASAAVDLRIRVPEVLELRLEGHPAALEITAADVARGEVVVTGPRVHVAANDRRGFVVEAQLRDPAFAGFHVQGLPATLACDCASSRTAMPFPGRRIAAPVEYRLQLSPAATPGRYAWPLTLSLQHP